MRKSLIALIAGLGLLSAACAVDIEANADGSLTVQSFVTEVDFQDALDKIVHDPNVEDLQVDFRDGGVSVFLEGRDEHDGSLNTISFEATLSVVDGHLGAEIFDAAWNGEPIPQRIVDKWNDSLARELEREGRKDPDSTLMRVDVSEDDIAMEWRVETDASRG